MNAKAKTETEDRGRYKTLLETDHNLRRWYQNNAKGSVIVAEVYLRRLGSFCIQNKMSPRDYAKLPKRKMEDIAFDHIQEMEARVNPKSGKKYAPSYVDSNLKAILSWARWNRKSFEMRIKIADSSRRPTLENERVPTNDELRRVLYADTTPLRTRASIAIMAFAGCRPEVQGNYLGLEGLRIKDIPELVIDNGMVSFSNVPALMIVRSELSKSRHWYPTFMLEEGCEILKEYLERRIADGEKLAPESGIITSNAHAQEKLSNLKVTDASPFIRTTKLGFEINKAMRASGLPWRPYVFRSYFDTALLLGESKGLVSHAYQQCWMGHKGSIEATYTLRKGELPVELLEDMRSAYGRVSESLGTAKRASEASKEMIMETFNRQYLTMAGFSEDEITQLGDLSKLTPQQIQEMIKQRSMKALGLNGNNQKVVSVSEVKTWIQQGWEYVNSLPDSEAIIRLPAR